jgi:hypothetical protein
MLSSCSRAGEVCVSHAKIFFSSYLISVKNMWEAGDTRIFCSWKLTSLSRKHLNTKRGLVNYICEPRNNASKTGKYMKSCGSPKTLISFPAS